MSAIGLNGKEIGKIILSSFEGPRWYTRDEAIKIVEESGLLTESDLRVIGSGETQFHRRTSNSLRDLCKTGELEKNEIRRNFWQYRKRT